MAGGIATLEILREPGSYETLEERSDALARGLAEAAKAHNVPVGHPHVDSDNVAEVLEEGYRFLMPSAGRNYGSLTKGRQLADGGRVGIMSTSLETTKSGRPFTSV